jgi:GntR family negative regulator for fad regulon and positive regulator of fabA
LPVNWSQPPRPAELTEQRLIQAVLSGEFPPGSTLPSERELAALLGVTRPTLREVLQRLARDGWFDIQHGKPTRVRDYWREGNMNVLSALVRHSERLPDDFVPNLLAVRLSLAPAYTRAAVERAADEVVALLNGCADLEDDAHEFAQADWNLHHGLTLASGNPVFTLILNGFADFYVEMAGRYFSQPNARAASRRWYADLLTAAQSGDAEAAERATRQAMQESIEHWRAMATPGRAMEVGR